ncbi:MAG: aldose 1-epimerase family protein [Chloroflexota bacterium]|nr:aldose 1-epimerase family protein [Anaerolineae bacterium]
MPMLYGKEWSREEIQQYTADMSQLAYVRRFMLREGRAEGVDAADIATGSGFQFTALPGRALDISHASYRGIPFCWRTSTSEVAASYYEPEGAAWHRTAFGGLMSTGGLSTMGSPSVDAGEALGHHGRASNIPASNVWADAAWEGDTYRLWVRGKVAEAEALGTHLVMTREISTELGASHFTIRDRVENRTFKRKEHMMLYHFNIGFPLLSANARLVTNSEHIEPRGDHSKAEFKRWDRFEPPLVDRPHQLFYHKLRPDHEGKVHVILAGMPDYAEGPIAVYLSFTYETLPWFVNWKSMIAGDYVTGIEPANAWVEGRAAEREAGRLRFLEPWESVDYEVQFGVLAGLPAINEFAEAHDLPRLNQDLS